MSDADLTARIHRRAYQIWEGEGRPPGRHLTHWLQAEQEVRSEPLSQAQALPRAGKRSGDGIAAGAVKPPAPASSKRARQSQ